MFASDSNLRFNDGKPLVLRFGGAEWIGFTQKTPWFDHENDFSLYWYRNEKDTEKERHIDYDYICGNSSVTFLFDDGTTKQFKTDHGDCLWSEWDDEEEKPIGVYKDLIEFLEDYIKNGGCESESKYMITNEVEFMDI